MFCYQEIKKIMSKFIEKKRSKLWQLGAQNNLISISPRYILEAFGLLIIASVSYGLVQLNNQNNENSSNIRSNSS